MSRNVDFDVLKTDSYVLEMHNIIIKALNYKITLEEMMKLLYHKKWKNDLLRAFIVVI